MPTEIPLPKFADGQAVSCMKPGHVQGIPQTILELIGYFRVGECHTQFANNVSVHADLEGWYYRTERFRLHESRITAIDDPEPKAEQEEDLAPIEGELCDR